LAATTEPTSTGLRARPRPQIIAHRAEREAGGWTSWITTTDHKKIGIMYLATVLVFFVLGGVEALVYILVLPAFGVISEVLPGFARKPIFGFRALLLVSQDERPNAVRKARQMVVPAVPRRLPPDVPDPALRRPERHAAPHLRVLQRRLGGVQRVNVARSLRHGRPAGADPWKANTLEWFPPSPPPENNFDVIPQVRSVEPMKDIRREIEQRTGAHRRP
jgi:heme/copper-type cytochrome/quinol oxidase subunit 1